MEERLETIENTTRQLGSRFDRLESLLRETHNEPSELLREMKTNVTIMKSDVGYIQKDVLQIKKELGNKYVTHTEMKPIKDIVYGMIGLILVAVVGAVMTIILK